MSFKKIQLIDPSTIGCPEEGHIYFGRDEYGLWEKYSNCTWIYITTGITTGGNDGSSGSSGVNGLNGTFYGTNGSSGTSGKTGTSGTSGLTGTSGTSGLTGTSGKSGTSGSSGLTGTSGSSGLTGTSGSSGVDGNFYGSSGLSGSSGSSGFNGGYGGATRVWAASLNNVSSISGHFYTNSTNFDIITTLQLNKFDFDNVLLSVWISGWTMSEGILKIENKNSPEFFGLYNVNINGVVKTIGDSYTVNNMISLAANGNVVENEEYYISYVPCWTSGNLQILRGNAIYHRQFIGIDTVGDWRQLADGSGFHTEQCISIDPSVWSV